MAIRKKFIRILKQSKQALRSLKIKDSWRNIKPCEVLLMAHENDRNYLFENFLYSHIIDSLAYYLGGTNVSIQSVSLPFSKISLESAFGHPKSLNRAMFLAKFKWFMFGKIFAVKSIPKRFELKLWLKLLALAKPKVVIAIQPHPLLCKACRINNIKVFDYQHGMINERVKEYSSSFGMKTNLEYLPTGYICWDEESEKVIKLWATDKGIDVFVHGNPWINRFTLQHQRDDLVKNELKKLQKQIDEIGTRSFEKKILVTLQPQLDFLYPDNFAPNEFISPSLLEVIANSSVNVCWLIRLHPIQNKDRPLRNKILSFFENYDNVEIEVSTQSALPALLASVNGHITWNSCVVVEAANMGLHSFILDPRQTKVVESLANDAQINYELPFYSHIEQKNLATRATQRNCSEEIQVWLNSLSLPQSSNLLPEFKINLFLKDIGISQSDS